MVIEEKKRQVELFSFSDRMRSECEEAEMVETISLNEEEMKLVLMEKIKEKIKEERMQRFEISELIKEKELKIIFSQNFNMKKEEKEEIVKHIISQLVREGILFEFDKERKIYGTLTTEVISKEIFSYFSKNSHIFEVEEKRDESERMNFMEIENLLKKDLRFQHLSSIRILESIEYLVTKSLIFEDKEKHYKILN